MTTTVTVTENNYQVVDNSTNKTVIVTEEVTEVITEGIQGPEGAAGADGDVVVFEEFTATAFQTEFSVLATASEVRVFFVNGISYLEDVEIDPPGSGTVVYSGSYDLEAGDSVVIGFIE